jgi:hypothetical protein
LKLELQEYSENLVFQEEITLNKLPRRIDVLVLVLCGDIKIEKNLGKIFKGFNVFEYKSPNDTLTYYDFFTGLSYVMQYVSIEKNAVSIDDMTLSFVCMRKPVELLKNAGEKATIHTRYKGIYYVEGYYIPIQIIVSSELDERENLYLSSLRKGLDMESYMRMHEEPTTIAPEVFATYIEAVDDANPNLILEVFYMSNLAFEQIDAMKRERFMSRAEQMMRLIGLDKKYEDELRAKDRMIEAERLAKEQAEEKNRLLQEKIKELEIKVKN